jgi:transcriptional regulator with XRE-family HTH domain
MSLEMGLDLTYFADQLRLLRPIYGLTQENVAATCDLTTRTVEKLESGRHGPSEQTLRSLCRGLSIDRSYFIKPTAAEEAQRRVEMLKALRTTAVVQTAIVRTARDILHVFGGTHAWNLDLEQVDEASLPLAAGFVDNVTDWSEIWDEISMTERAEAAAGLVTTCGELGEVGYLAHIGRNRARRRFLEGPPLVFSIGLLSIRPTVESQNQSVAMVSLQDGWELLADDVPKFSLDV